MPLLIDTYNVLHVVGILPPDLAGIDIVGLIQLIHNSRYRNDHVLLVCDGLPHAAPGGAAVPPGETGIGSISIRYSGVNRKADDVIALAVHSSSVPRRLTVISSDHEVQTVGRRRRCKILSSETFLQQLADDAKAGPPEPLPLKPTSMLTDELVERWTNILGIDDATVAQLADEVETEATAREAVDDDWYEPDDDDTFPPDIFTRATPTFDQVPPAPTPLPGGPPPHPASPPSHRHASRRPTQTIRTPGEVLPADMIADAERMMAELEAQAMAADVDDDDSDGGDVDTRDATTDINSLQAQPTDRHASSDPVTKSTRQPPPSPGSIRSPRDVLPDDMIAQAERLITDLAATAATDQTTQRPRSAKSLLPIKPASSAATPKNDDPSDEPAPPQADILPIDLIAQAEAMLADDDDDDDDDDNHDHHDGKHGDTSPSPAGRGPG